MINRAAGPTGINLCRLKTLLVSTACHFGHTRARARTQLTHTRTRSQEGGRRKGGGLTLLLLRAQSSLRGDAGDRDRDALRGDGDRLRGLLLLLLPRSRERSRERSRPPPLGLSSFTRMMPSPREYGDVNLLSSSLRIAYFMSSSLEYSTMPVPAVGGRGNMRAHTHNTARGTRKSGKEQVRQRSRRGGSVQGEGSHNRNQYTTTPKSHVARIEIPPPARRPPGTCPTPSKR